MRLSDLEYRAPHRADTAVNTPDMILVRVNDVQVTETRVQTVFFKKTKDGIEISSPELDTFFIRPVKPGQSHRFVLENLSELTGSLFSNSQDEAFAQAAKTWWTDARHGLTYDGD